MSNEQRQGFQPPHGRTAHRPRTSTQGINEEGSMILQTSDGLKLINSGECSIKGIY